MLYFYIWAIFIKHLSLCYVCILKKKKKPLCKPLLMLENQKDKTKVHVSAVKFN